jgi:hypothetical protein
MALVNIGISAGIFRFLAGEILRSPDDTKRNPLLPLLAETQSQALPETLYLRNLNSCKGFQANLKSSR